MRGFVSGVCRENSMLGSSAGFAGSKTAAITRSLDKDDAK
jgi:hypothetical protein